MPGIPSIPVQNDFLDLILESASWAPGLIDADGGELSGNGYARASTLTAASWAAAADGAKSTTGTVSFGAPTGDWADAVEVALFRVADGEQGPTVPLSEPLSVTGAGDPPTLQRLTVWFAQVDPSA